ncbi:MAG: hypothetical protein JO362_22760 [Streptomycetaceae bacterium]|nr:hypothetical protein [Streptomycetaceae bacterium]
MYLSGSAQHRDAGVDLDATRRVVSQFDASVAADRANVQLRVQDIRRSRLVVAVADDARTSLTRGEVGVAIDLGIPVLLVGSCSAELDAHPGIAITPDADAALDAAIVWATG